LIQSWNEGWIQAQERIGDKLAPIIGARVGEVAISDSTTINLFKLTGAALKARPGRKKIVSDGFNFPSDVYTFQGIIDTLGQGHTLELVESRDSLTIDPADLAAIIDDTTALVSLSHVAFKTAFMYDMPAITSLAHQSGALILWDLSHSAGSVPVDLTGSSADLAVGCTYKYLNGGPGSPAFLYVRQELQTTLIPPTWGWFAQQQMFDFDLDFTPADDIRRYLVGTPPILSTLVIEPAIDLLLEAGIDNLRAKSIAQTEYLIALADAWLGKFGFELGSPRQWDMRGSHVSLRHPEGYRICRALIEAQPPAVRIVPDFRAPDNIRLGIAPMYTSYVDIFRAMSRLQEIMAQKLYRQYSITRALVT
jgi:kynureninase